METNSSQPPINLKRAYDPEEPSDGFRIYIDRLWPRGLSHATFKYDLWEKEVAPSASLREWFHADPENRWEEFSRRYGYELHANPAFATLKETVKAHSEVTLLYSSHDRTRNNAIVLKKALAEE